MHEPGHCCSGTSTPKPVVATPEREIWGLPPVQHLAVLQDRRHVLTQDATGDVELWDLTGTSPVQRVGKARAPFARLS